MSQLKKRSEMDPKWMWNLNDILNGTEAFNALFEKAEKALAEFAACQGHVAEDPRKAIQMNFEGTRMIEKLFTYARMHSDENGADGEAQLLLTRVQGLAARAAGASAFLQPELLSLPEEVLLEMKNDPDFNEYDVFIDDILRDKPHTLPAEQEKLLAMAGEVMGAPHSIFNMLSPM